MLYQRKPDQSLYWLYLLPLIHLTACFSIAILQTAWWPMTYADFPVAPLLFALSWHFGYPLLWFGLFGTVWWLILAEGVVLYREANRKRRR